MSLYLETFGATQGGGTALPDGLATQNVMPDALTPSMIKLPGGGVFNPWGDDEALPQGTILVARGAYTAATRAALLTLVDGLRAWNGKWSNLYVSTAAAAWRWRKARMWCDDQPVTPHSIHGFWQPMTLTFELGDTIWHGDDATDTITMTVAASSGEINNAGNGLVRDIVLTYTVAGAGNTVTNLIVENEETDYICKIQYAGTIALGKALVIDCGAKTVKNDGSNDFANFSIVTATHTKTEWLVLKPGDNTIKATRTSGNATDTLGLAFEDAHK